MKKLLSLMLLTLTLTFTLTAQQVDKLLITYETNKTYQGDYDYGLGDYEYEVPSDKSVIISTYYDKGGQIKVIYDGILYNIIDIKIGYTTYLLSDDKNDTKFSVSSYAIEKYTNVKNGFYKNIEINIISKSEHKTNNDAVDGFRFCINNKTK